MTPGVIIKTQRCLAATAQVATVEMDENDRENVDVSPES